MKKLKIVKGFYRTAGMQYGWPSDIDVRGIGVNRLFFEEPKLEISVEGKKYELDTKEGLEFVNKYHSVMYTRYGKIGVVSKSLLKEI